MCDPVVARTNAGGVGGRRITRGTVYCADDPVVRAKPRLFVPARLAHHCGVEQATAAPGELRQLPGPAVNADTGEVTPAGEPLPEVVAAKRPPRSGPGSGIEAWRAYVSSLPASPPPAELADLSRDDLIELAGD